MLSLRMWHVPKLWKKKQTLAADGVWEEQEAARYPRPQAKKIQVGVEHKEAWEEMQQKQEKRWRDSRGL